MHYKFWEEEEEPQQETFSRSFAGHLGELEKRRAGTKPPRFGRLAGLILALGLAVYGLASGDVPLICLTAAMLAFGIKEAAVKVMGERGRALANALQGFAVVLGLGALAMLLL